jgi:hypothetical protein
MADNADTNVDLAHETAKSTLNEIIACQREITRLEVYVKERRQTLEETCPHREVRKEYDDDFHRPRSYMMCRLCGAEV